MFHAHCYCRSRWLPFNYRTATAQVHAAVRKHTEIPAESLDLALRALSRERGFQLVYLTENVAAVTTRGAIGDFTVDEALTKLLSDSHLEYKFVDENTVSIFSKPNTKSSSSTVTGPVVSAAVTRRTRQTSSPSIGRTLSPRRERPILPALFAWLKHLLESLFR